MYRKIELFILEKTGLNFSGNKSAPLARVVQSRMIKHGTDSEQTYLDLLDGNLAEQKVLYDLITTKETHFFRNEQQFDYLMKVIVPDIEVNRGGNAWKQRAKGELSPAMQLRVLCAGCSTGEEAYSVAMAILSSMRYPLAWDIRIVAGDLSHACLTTAENGYYSDEKARAIPQHLLASYSIKEEGGIRLTKEVKKVIRFVPLNLKRIMDGEPVPEAGTGGEAFDLIFCRNVMIYFPSDVQQRLVETLAHWLVPGGYLFTGDAEPLHLFNHDLMVMREAECLVYRKMENTDAIAVAQHR